MGLRGREGWDNTNNQGRAPPNTTHTVTHGHCNITGGKRHFKYLLFFRGNHMEFSHTKLAPVYKNSMVAQGPELWIINLSKKTLTPAEISVLNKGLLSNLFSVSRIFIYSLKN